MSDLVAHVVCHQEYPVFFPESVIEIGGKVECGVRSTRSAHIHFRAMQKVRAQEIGSSSIYREELSFL